MDNEYIEFIRFESDKRNLIKEDKSLIHQINSTKRSLLSNSLRVTQETVPFLHKQIAQCSKILNIQLDKIDVYVYSQPDYNAFSISKMDATILIGISSSLIKILDSLEIRFLIGHELGHAILGHSESMHLSNGNLSYELLKTIRHKEISADRVGYLCSMSLDKSIISMMKIASGLDGDLLTKDIRPFIDQSIGIGNLLQSSIGDYSKHLPLPIRARALVWFSTMKLFDGAGVINDLKKENYENIRSINLQINKIVSTLLDKQREKSFQTTKEFFKLILYTWHYSIDGNLSKNEQTYLIQLFGDNAKKIFSLMDGLSKSSVLEMLERKLKDTFNDLLYYSPDISMEYLQYCCKNLDISVDKVMEMINPIDFYSSAKKSR